MKKVSSVSVKLRDVSDKGYKNKERSKRFKEGFLTDEDIKRIRKKLGFTQKQMAEKLGVGLKTFARYENLSVRQGKAMDNLLRIFDKYPEVMAVFDKKIASS
ncbi:MAG: type II TA system antitoxin MqsA family protein [Dissulfurispiraceae bacterium]